MTKLEAKTVKTTPDMAVLLGLKPMSQFDWAKRIVHGFSVKTLDGFVKRSGLTRQETINAIGMTPGQLLRRRRAGTLTCVESERLYRLAQLVSRSAELFGSMESGTRWLRKPHPLLRGAAPLELVLTEPGSQEVQRIITATEHGFPV